MLSRRRIASAALLSGIVLGGARSHHAEPPIVQPNPNTVRAGVMRDNVLTVALEAKLATYEIDGPSHPSIEIEAFAEPGKPPLIPGPLIRAPVGTEVDFSIHNSLNVPLTFLVPTTMHGGPDRFDAMDSVVIAAGAIGHLRTRPTAPGNFIYRGTTPAAEKRFRHMNGILAGAFVVDTVGAAAAANDRVLVFMAAPDVATRTYLDTVSPARYRGAPREAQTINGLSWPNTERIRASVGDSVHWRLLNASELPHPMHLHGFYYRVDDFSGPEADLYGRPSPKAMVVTQLMPEFSTMSMTWSPNRAGNWLFHCHFAVHLRPDSLSAAADDPYHRDMVGMVLGTIVAPRSGVTAAGNATPARQLRLVATAKEPQTIGRFPFEKPARTNDSVPPMHFTLEEHGRRVDTHTDLSPELDLVRGEPVAITIVNHLPEATSVHWHGIEVQDSYADGVPGFSGNGTHLTPAIAPGDSFVARFTPPRAGTFMYHAHIDEIREQLAGLEGTLVVREPGVASSPDDHVFFFKEVSTSRVKKFEMNGQANPDIVVLHAGVPARLRILNLNTNFFAPIFVLGSEADSAAGPNRSSLAEWKLVAKDGFDLPEAEQSLRTARQVIGIGETYDFQYTPRARGKLRLEIWSSYEPERLVGPRLLMTVPFRVE